MPVRLPPEAEWEYACRTGASTRFHFGDSPAELSTYTWFENNSGGLFDTVDNDWEWCADRWNDNYTSAPCDDSPWLAATLRRRCVREGAWYMEAFRCSSSYLSYDWEEIETNRTGFRIVADSIRC